MRFTAPCAGALVFLLFACGQTALDDSAEAEGQSRIVRGQEEAGLDPVVLVHAQRAGGITRCSGTAIAPRVVLTAAHCIRPDTIHGRVFVYFGEDYATEVAMLPGIPAPGQASPWARVESWLVHPSYSASLNYPDLAVLYLDRPLPFAPMPLLTERVGHRDLGKLATVAGWGASESLDPDLTQVVGVGVKRSGTATIVGSPTESDYHTDDPNPGLLDVAIRRDLLKTDGHAPSANPCAGDSGGPLFVRRHGRPHLAGVGFWTGLSCEDYSIFTRIDPFLDFIADAVRGAGGRPVQPSLTCVGENGDGSLTAYFGYRNDNSLTVTVPPGPANAFFPAVAGEGRPSSFSRGQHDWTFGADFTAGQRLLYLLMPPAGPLTVLPVDASAPRCTEGDQGLTCARQCRAIEAAACQEAGSAVTFEQCATECLSMYTDLFPGCEAEWGAYLQCVTALPPDPASWLCLPDLAPQPVGCDDAFFGALACAGYL